MTRFAQARWAAFGIFFLNGVVIATWLLCIPTVRDQLRIGPGTLGLALLALPAGSLCGMPLTGGWTERWGSRAVTIVATIMLALTLTLPVLAATVAQFACALFLVGVSTGSMDVAMNAQGVTVERLLGRPMISSFHAGYSCGALSGAALGGLLMAAHVGAVAHTLGVGTLTAAGALLAWPFLFSRADERSVAAAPGESVASAQRMGLVGLGALCFIALFAEGAIGDWSALYFRDVLQAGPAASVGGFTAFSLAMVVGRGLGDNWRRRLGDTVVVLLGGLVAALGLVLGLTVPWPLLASVGFAGCGLGYANVVPVLFSIAGRAHQGPGIATVATIGYMGFMLGPPLIGGIAEFFGLRLALTTVATGGLLIAASSRRVFQRLRD